MLDLKRIITGSQNFQEDVKEILKRIVEVGRKGNKEKAIGKKGKKIGKWNCGA